MITVKVTLLGAAENKQKLALSFSKSRARVRDIIENLSEVYPDLKSCFYHSDGKLSAALKPASENGVRLMLNSTLKDKMMIEIDISEDN